MGGKVSAPAHSIEIIPLGVPVRLIFFKKVSWLLEMVPDAQSRQKISQGLVPPSSAGGCVVLDTGLESLKTVLIFLSEG